MDSQCPTQLGRLVENMRTKMDLELAMEIEGLNARERKELAEILEKWCDQLAYSAITLELSERQRPLSLKVFSRWHALWN